MDVKEKGTDMKCIRCGKDTANVLSYIVGKMNYVTCRECNQSYAISYGEPKVNLSESAEIVATVDLPQENVVDPIPVPTPEEIISPEASIEPLELTGECPKCGAEGAVIEMDTATLGYFKCASCGYDSKLENKRHKVK